jgi:TPR repeat protein
MGYRKATHNLAVMYHRGAGVQQDSEKAAALFQQVATAKAGKPSARPNKIDPSPIMVAVAAHEKSWAGKA